MKAEDIARTMGLDISGDTVIVVSEPAALSDAGPGGITWLNAWSPSAIETVSTLEAALIVHPPADDPDAEAAVAAAAGRNALIQTKTPRLVFARLLETFFSDRQAYVAPGIDDTARIDPGAILEENVRIGAFCVVGPDVVIGRDTVLHPHVVVYSGSTIGRRCVINSGVAIGTRGFGFVKDENGDLRHFPHVGRVIIGNDVEIQSNTTVARPGLGYTRIEHGAKIDCLCHIGHNARIEHNAMVAACTEIGANVVVGDSAWIGPNTCSLEDVTFGTNSFTGIGSVVLTNVPPGETVVGSPAMLISDVKRTRTAIRNLVAGKKE